MGYIRQHSILSFSLFCSNYSGDFPYSNSDSFYSKEFVGYHDIITEKLIIKMSSCNAHWVSERNKKNDSSTHSKSLAQFDSPWALAILSGFSTRLYAKKSPGTSITFYFRVSCTRCRVSLDENWT